MKLTKAELSALRAIIHGAQDDDNFDDPEYTAALSSLSEKVKAERVAAMRDR